MTDRALLEAAARAAGVRGAWDSKAASGKGMFIQESGYCWVPLSDDGDALRLAVRLGFQVDIETACGLVSIGNVGESFLFDDYAAALAATRRAIVRAAAAMAKEER